LIGYGNELRGDDGAAWELARRAAAVGWETLCVVQLTPELAATVCQFDQVVFVDATHEPGPLGWQLLKARAGRDGPIHSGEPARLLGMCQSLYGKAPKAWVMTLPGEDFGYRLGLSACSQASVVAGLERLRKLRRR
jgi:hydrogenase maturation protease